MTQKEVSKDHISADDTIFKRDKTRHHTDNAMDYIWITVAVFLVLRAEAAPGKTNAKVSRFLYSHHNTNPDSYKVDHCSINPCQNGGTCENHYTHAECRCTDAYTGKNCETLKDHCASYPCQHGGTCHNEMSFHLFSMSQYSYRCDCQAGWIGHSCEIVDPCSSNPCQNSGTCNHSFHHPHGYYCTCKTGYIGDYCETDVSTMSDPCGNQPCKNGGGCKSTGGSYVCTCPPNWSGTKCDTDINECDTTDQCRNGGNCTNTDGAFSCKCKAGWTGTVCDNDIDECTMYHFCQNNATCLNLPGHFHCTCATGYSGVQCAHEDDPCIPTNPCQNGATCNRDSSGQATCSCLPGYFGALCDKGQPNTCDHICTLQSLASQHSLQSANAATCSSSSFGSNEALPMQCCSTLASSSWTKGPDVMTQCKSGTMTPYTTVAIFRSDGTVEPDTAGILTECLSGGAGFSIVRQDCKSLPTLIHVNGTAIGQVDNNPGHYSIVL